MKNMVCEQPKHFRMGETEAPLPKAGEALVRIRRIGVCGTDLHAYQGNQPYFTYPRVLGHELSGTIEAVGGNVSGFQKGDQVAVIPYLECDRCIACRRGRTNCCTSLKVLGVHMDGGMCEYLAVPADHLMKTEGISLDQSAILEPLSIGAHAVRRAELFRDEIVLVIGGGPIGLGVMAFTKQQGAKVIAMDINEERLGFCKSWAGVDHTVNALQQADESLAAITGGEFPTAVFDATGSTRSMNGSFQYVAHGGKLIFVGLVKDDISFSDPEFHKREMTLLSSRNAVRADFDLVFQAVKSGAISSDRYITHHCGFDEMVGQFDSWLLPETKVVKAMIELN